MKHLKNFNNIPALNREIKIIINQYKSHEKDFPVELNFNESMEQPQFKVTIQKLDTDVYVDKTGQKWKKVTQ